MGKKCPQNGVIMAQNVGTRARERGDKGHMSEPRAGMRGRWAEIHPRAQDEMRIQKGGLPHLF